LQLADFNVVEASSSSGTTCIAPIRPLVKLFLSTLAPAFYALILLSIFWLQKLFSNFIRSWQRFAPNKQTYIRTFVAIVLLAYNTVTTSVLQFFDCIDVGDTAVLRSLPGVVCGSSTYDARQGYFLALLLLFPIGLPILLMPFLRWRRMAWRDQLGPFFEMYKYNRWWWEVVWIRCSLLFVTI